MGRITLSQANTALSTGITRRSRRGVAMLLVIISVTVATILAAAVLTSRNNSAAIGENAVDGAASAWAAESAAQYSVALLETGADWFAQLAANGGTNTMLLDDFSFAGANIDVMLTRMDGTAPVADDTELVMTATATVNGMVTTVKKIVTVSAPKPPQNAVDPKLHEFAVYARNALEIADDSALIAWDLSAGSIMNPQVKVGGKFPSSANIVISSSAVKTRAALYVEDDASSTVKDLIGGTCWTEGNLMPLGVPCIADKVPVAFASLPVQAVDVRLSAEIPFTITVPARYQACDLSSGAEMTLDELYGRYYSFSSMRLTDRAVMRIKGTVLVYVGGDMEFSNYATIELMDETSRLVLYVLDEMRIQDAGVGVSRDVSRSDPRKPAMITEYVDPSRITVYGIAAAQGGTDDARWEISNNSIAICSLNAPSKAIEIDGESILIGRATGATVTVKNSSRILYDPLLDNRQGFTTLTGPLYQRDGQPLRNLETTINTFDWTQGYTAFASHLESQIDGGVIYDDSAPDPDSVAPRDDSLCEYRPLPLRAFLQEAIGSITGSNKPVDDEGAVMAQSVGGEETEIVETESGDEEIAVTLPLLGKVTLLRY